MFDPREIIILHLCLLAIFITVTECGYLPKKPARKAFEKKQQFAFSNNPTKDDKNFLANLKIPNRQFCSEMILKPEDHYLVLPWWYNYCQDLKEKHSGGIKGIINRDNIYKYILAEVQLYKKRLNEKTSSMTELEKELTAFNNKRLM